MANQDLMSKLRATTQDAHQRLESLPFPKALSDGDLPLESYVGYLRAMAIVHGVLEHELPVEADERIAAVWDDEMRRLPALQRDLAHFAPRSVRDIPTAITAAEKAAGHLLQRSVERPLSMLGYLYVLEGAALGAAVLGPWAKQAFGLNNGAGMAYLEHHGELVRDRWQTFAERIDALELETENRTAILDAAEEAFAGVYEIMGALYPFDADSLVLKVTSLNPEAGTHPVPQDPREVEAAQRAGERCIREYPYFVWRYGERGKRFTDSDSAWLATLTKYPVERIERQVAWLAQVLATRGMPRVLLQRHLELLYEELVQRVPERHDDYAKLLAVANRLIAGRNAIIDDNSLDAIAQGFDSAVGPDWRARLPGTGWILACAVADDHAGLDGTLASVRGWLSDADIFPERWIRAVEQCIKEAGACITSGQNDARP